MINPQTVSQSSVAEFERLRRRVLLALVGFSPCLLLLFAFLPAMGLALIDTAGRDLSRDLILGLVGLTIFGAAFVRVQRISILSWFDKLFFVGLPCVFGVVVVQFNGTLPLALISVPYLFLLGLYAPAKFIWPLAITYVVVLYLIQHYTTFGLHDHAVDARVFQSLVTLIWPMHTLATSTLPSHQLKARLARQLMLVTVASSFWWLFDPTLGKNGMLSGALALVLWIWMRKAAVLNLGQRIAILVSVVGAYSVAVLQNNSLPLHAIAGWLLMIFCVLPRFWATFLSGLMILFASVGFDIGNPLVLRGVVSALFVLMIFNLWFAASGQDYEESLHRPSLLIALGFGGANLLLDQLPYLASQYNAKFTAETLLTDLLHFGVVTWLVYEFMLFLRRSQTAISVAQAQVQQRESALTAAAEMSGVGLYQINLGTKQFNGNRQYYQILGFEFGNRVDLEQVMANIPVQERDKVRELIHQHAGSPEALELEHKYDRDGDLRDLQIRIQYQNDSAGSRVLIAARDVTSAKQQLESLKAATARFELALGVAGLAMFELDVATERVTLISGPYFLAHRFETYTLSDLAERYIPAAHERTQFLEACRAEHRSAEYQFIEPSTEESRWARIQTGATYQRDGEAKRLMVRLDITEERRSIKNLREAQEHQRELFAIIGHELRTPVSAIDMAMADTDMSAEEKIRIAAELSASLLNILEDLRTVVSPDRAMQARDLAASPANVCERAVTALLPLASEFDIELDYSADRAAADEYMIQAQALRQIATNLTKNALLHSQAKHVCVRLSGSGAAPGKQRFALRVEDDGVGIPESERANLFKKFSRGTTSADGSGLGLYIVTELAKKLDGTLSYEARDEGGSIFIFEFHAASSSSVVESLTAGVDSPLAGKRVLVAEDDKLIRMLTEKVLLNAKAIVTLAENGQEASMICASSSFDLVLTDIMMPIMDGYELCETLRTRGYKGPIIGLTAAVVGAETDRLIEAGADRVLSKPIKIERLRETLGELTSQSTAKEKGA